MRNTAVFLLTSVLAIRIGAYAAAPPRFYPAEDAPLSAEPFLAQVESAFAIGSPQPTLKFPIPATGARLASSEEFLLAVEAAITAAPTDAAAILLAARKAARISDDTPLNRPIAVNVPDMLFTAAAVPTVTPHFGEILAALLAEDPAETTMLTSNAIAAAAANGATAAELGAMAQAGAAALVDGYKPANARYESFARAVLVATITESLTGGNNGELASAIVAGMVRGIRDRGLETPLLDDIVRGSARAYGLMPNVTLADIATAAFTEATPTRHHAILIAAACIVGTPFFYLDTPIDQEVATAGATAAPTFAAAISTAATHALHIRLTELRVVGPDTLARIKADGTAASDAVVCSALMASPTKSYDILRAGFDGSYGPGITPPPMTFPTWLRIVLSGNPAFTAESLSFVLDRGNAEGLFVGGVTLADAAAAVLTAGLPSSTAAVLAEVKNLIQSGEATDLPANVGALTAAIAASPQPIEVADAIAPMLVGTVPEKSATLKKAILGTTDPALRGTIAAAAILAEPDNTAAFTTAALAADASTTDNPAISAAIAGTQIRLVAAQPKWRIASVLKSLANSHSGETLAVVYGALTAAPQHAATILAAALSADAAFDLETATALDPDSATSLALAAKIAAAEVEDAADPGATLAMLFDTVDSAVLAHPTDVLGFTAAASIAAPRYAHHTLHAAAFRYPAIALRTVQTTFDAAPIAAPGNQTARAAALGAALINGLREARTGKLAANQMRLAIGTAVQSARVLVGPVVATSQGVPGRAVLTTNNGPAAIITGVASQLTAQEDTFFRGTFLLTTSTAKARGHGLAMAQAAAQASVSIAGTKVNTNSIVSAVAAGSPPFTAAQIRNAAMWGKLKARLSTPGAGADGVRNYQHRSGTTDPVASLDDL